jgi:tripartite-type tricarboxylate transporter receptor subunit TctC
VVVENRPGAGGYTGTDSVARAEPDGYTILLTGNGITSYPIFLKDNRIDPLKSLAPLSLAMETPWIIVTNSTVPARNLAEYIAHARANPGRLNFAVVTNTNQQLDTARFFRLAGIEVTLVNYQGSAPVYTALLAGEVQGYFGAYSQIAPHARTGKLTPLAVFAPQRISQMPSLPTARESGIDQDASAWFGFYAPAGTAPSIVAKLAAEAGAAVRGDLAPRIRELGNEPVGSTPERLAAVMAKELAVYTEIAKALGVKPQ